eukprot:scaffold68537_cov47-Cyclotella_meneghiniana.AAC.3
MGREFSCRKESRASAYLRHGHNEKNVELAENTTINPRWGEVYEQHQQPGGKIWVIGWMPNWLCRGFCKWHESFV